MTEVVNLFLAKLNFGPFESQTCRLQRCEHFLEGDKVALEGVIDKNQIIHIRKDAGLRAKMTWSQRHNVLKQPRRIRYPKRHTLKTVLAARCDEGSSVDVLLGHRQLPERVEDVTDGDVEGVSDGIQAGLEIGHGPALADDVAVEGVAVINTETGATVALSDDSTRATPRTWPFFNYAPFQHVVDTLVNDRRGRD